MPTLGSFLTTISANIGLNNTGVIGSSQTSDQNLMIQWVNEAYAEILSRKKVNITSATMTLTAGDYDYTLPSQIMSLTDIYLTDASTSVWYKLHRKASDEILEFRVGTQFQGSPPVRWYAVQGFNLLMVYPTPIAADVLTLYYVPRPATLAATGDLPSLIPAEWQKAIEYYACWQAGKYINDSASQNGQTFMQLYEAELIRMNKARQFMGGRKLSPAVVGRNPGSRHAPIGLPSQTDV